MGNFSFEPINFILNLKWMGIGMLGVFMIVGIIMLATYITNYTVNKISNKNNGDQ